MMDSGASPKQTESFHDAPEDAAWIDVMEADDLWIGDRVEAESVAGPLLLINLAGTVFAYENRCPHKGGRLGDGEFANGVIVCPIHRWEFCAHGGAGINPAGTQLKRYAVRIADGRIQVAWERV
ncbi:Rieske 2Fe-2S domain-containing protein [Paraburkholderia sp. DHOC27]|uniref:Rieske (2Fe-2S) protein n=1 Tax=Paraburkholderia sp. DHOC27 TaxID=2303330 RepID=UPI000E3ED426|nr:Rieske 2Fe-2S domain-containing protein [Paraburkholderia sp. DHOC27]RFU45236.1 (2Fe-2S)-binding protein [Paraburkholderia sp. DHOC27]